MRYWLSFISLRLILYSLKHPLIQFSMRFRERPGISCSPTGKESEMKGLFGAGVALAAAAFL
ncbi:hypothetical protein, partial [Hyalangium rubrum]